ncbi:energy transducer TonB [Mangrovibacterium lignilyticum]|uniref:energy transducer TonB n=1 Tax=Mangrovibacterium lignilyticum TaxID=2668052 RepID=UPI0013D3871F|nr:energy transducer TonB [Mangrovibacterium lignilyticum]
MNFFKSVPGLIVTALFFFGSFGLDQAQAQQSKSIKPTAIARLTVDGELVKIIGDPAAVEKVKTILAESGCFRRVRNLTTGEIELRQNGENWREAKSEQIDENSRYQADSVHYVVDEFPVFQGGVGELHNFIVENLNYPDEAKEAGLSGEVFVSFVVDKDGQVGNARIVRSVHPVLDQEALRIVRLLPKWEPGRKEGVPVNVAYTIPILFSLD